MIIHLKEWQKSLIQDLLDRLPLSVKGPLNASVEILTYIEKQTGDGFYKDKIAYISRGIRHPRLMLERTCHEWGHGIEEWLIRNGYPTRPFDSETIADGFAISILYPYILEKNSWDPIKRLFRSAFFQDGFPGIDTEGLIENYAKRVKTSVFQRRAAMGALIHGRLEDFFNAQRDGFLTQYHHVPRRR